MDVFEAFKSRHSYRGEFLDEPVCRENLKKIVASGLLAPSGKNCQTTEFVVIDDPHVVSEIQQISAANKAVQQAKAYIVCIVNRESVPVFQGMSFEIEDCSAAVENMLLAITSLGYASVWVDGWIRSEGRNDRIGELIGLPHGKVVRIILPIGVPAKKMSQPEKMPFEQRVWFNGYGK